MKIWKNLKMWDLWWTFPLIFFVAYYLDEIIHFIDPSGAVVHPDIWQFDFMAWARAILYANAAFAFIAINLPFLFKWYSESFSSKNIELTPWQKALLFLAFFSVILFAQVAIFNGLVS